MMHALKPAVLLLAPLALGACTHVQGTPIMDAQQVQPSGTVPLGQPVRVGSMVATPLEVAEDSRCPMNARCVWAGRVILVTRIDGAGWSETVPLTLGEPHGTPKGVTISLTSVSPERVTGKEPVPGEYRFGFEGGN
ncbi:MAG TPA: hypothetical protein VL094_03115 [Sphingomonadaceae bacterium]|nr:hypothetical protein [Sphingomonadaceae bacterium]